jgi:hypothetical protein
MSINIFGQCSSHTKHINCATSHKKGDLWLCLADESERCPRMVIYKGEKYCLNEYNEHFSIDSGRKRKHLLIKKNKSNS